MSIQPTQVANIFHATCSIALCMHVCGSAYASILQLKLEIERKCFLPSSLAEPENGIIGEDNTIIFDLSYIKIIIYLNLY